MKISSGEISATGLYSVILYTLVRCMAVVQVITARGAYYQTSLTASECDRSISQRRCHQRYRFLAVRVGARISLTNFTRFMDLPASQRACVRAWVWLHVLGKGRKGKGEEGRGECGVVEAVGCDVWLVDNRSSTWDGDWRCTHVMTPVSWIWLMPVHPQYSQRPPNHIKHLYWWNVEFKKCGKNSLNSELRRTVTCHMRLYSVTYTPTQGNVPRFNRSRTTGRAGTRFTYPGRMKNWVDKRNKRPGLGHNQSF